MALYWAEELAARDKAWEPLAQALKDNEETIVKELIECQVKILSVFHCKLDVDICTQQRWGYFIFFPVKVFFQVPTCFNHSTAVYLSINQCFESQTDIEKE